LNGEDATTVEGHEAVDLAVGCAAMGVVLLIVLVFVLAYGSIVLVRKGIGEDRWTKLMKYRRSSK